MNKDDKILTSRVSNLEQHISNLKIALGVFAALGLSTGGVLAYSYNILKSVELQAKQTESAFNELIANSNRKLEQIVQAQVSRSFSETLWSVKDNQIIFNRRVVFQDGIQGNNGKLNIHDDNSGSYFSIEPQGATVIKSFSEDGKTPSEIRVFVKGGFVHYESSGQMSGWKTNGSDYSNIWSTEKIQSK